MQAILIRVGADHSYGRWNAPVDPDTGEFVYAPTPEKDRDGFRPGCARDYAEIRPAVEAMAERQGLRSAADLGWPEELDEAPAHLDPDFEHLTYGDLGTARGAVLRELVAGDLLVFYAGLRPIRPCRDNLLYAIVGVQVVRDVVWAGEVPRAEWDANAHTRREDHSAWDVVVRADPRRSGRLTRCLPIGEYRRNAYRVRRDLLETWGELSVNDGYIQRSARPPRFLAPERFHEWFERQDVELVHENNPPAQDPPVVVVHLRQPRRNDPGEKRSDPFWEFGSFGCTGCHASNLLHPDHADELAGVRLGFVQGGPHGMKLVLLTPPVRVVRHGRVCEVRWDASARPFRYDAAPLVIDNAGRSDIPGFRKRLRGVARASWMAAFSSRFRSKRTPLPEELARQVRCVDDERLNGAGPGELADSYVETMPWPPAQPDEAREPTYARLLKKANARKPRAAGPEASGPEG